MKNLPKLLFTQAASKWKLILMNSHVSLQMGPRYKTIRTEPALVRRFPGMHPLMYNKMRRVTKHFVTIVTHVRFHVFVLLPVQP